jgi:hypothetical protein
MEVKPGVDRRRHEVDVPEQVMKGVLTQPSERGHASRIVDLSVRLWPGITAASAIQVHVIDDVQIALESQARRAEHAVRPQPRSDC